MNSFKKTFDFDTRKAEASRIISKYQDKVPIIVNRGNKGNIKDISKKKFLVPYDLTVSQFTTVIRKRIELKESEAMFIFINNRGKEILPLQSASVGSVYDQHKDEDGFLYITYAGENVFG